MNLGSRGGEVHNSTYNIQRAPVMLNLWLWLQIFSFKKYFYTGLSKVIGLEAHIAASDSFINNYDFYHCFHNQRCALLTTISVLFQKKMVLMGLRIHPASDMPGDCLFLNSGKGQPGQRVLGGSTISCHAKQKYPGTGLSSASVTSARRQPWLSKLSPLSTPGHSFIQRTSFILNFQLGLL